MKKIIIWLLAIGIITGISIYLYLFHFGAKHKDPLKAKNMVTVSATELYKLYESNEDSANKLYLGKVIKVTGELEAVDFDGKRYTLRYASGGGMGSVICEMDTVENPAVSQLAKGAAVSVAGFCNGINLDVYLDRCKMAE